MTFKELLLCAVSVNDRSTFACFKSAMETPEKCVKSDQILQIIYQNDIRRRSVVCCFVIVKFEQIPHIALAFQ